MSLTLFPEDKIVGAFRGFRDGGLEFHADLVLPYQNDFQSIPMHGQFLLVQLETPNEAVLGRITAFSSEGKLAHGQGEEFNLRAVREKRPIPEDLREQYLKYKVNIRVLGVLRVINNKINFVPSQRRLPHVGSPVAFASDEVLQEIAGHNNKGAAIGHLALGEYIYAGSESNIETEDWMQIKNPEVLVKFPVSSLVSRRSFIFARAGFGKSNLNKLLFSLLYKETPKVQKKNGLLEVPVGTIIFDPDGEYFWPDDKGRPGLCDVPHLEDKLVVFTPRESESRFYQSFVAGNIKLDIRQLNPGDVISIALAPERQEQQNVRKLKSLDTTNWTALVDLIDENGNQSSLDEISQLLGLNTGQQEVEAIAARSNMTTIVRMLHDKSSQLMDKLFEALGQGKICIVDISQLRGGPSLILSGIILRKIFDHNQQEFTKANSKAIPTIAVIEEAQSVLNEKASGSTPYIDWVKEGRKYDLGALLITQQPGSLPDEILSQGDNWFIFHLLSAGDLNSVRKANAHFSEDILSVLLNEPIPGHSVFWTSVDRKAYPISLRILSFEKAYKVADPDYKKEATNTFAANLKAKFENQVTNLIASISDDELVHLGLAESDNGLNSASGRSALIAQAVKTKNVDLWALHRSLCVTSLRNNKDLMTKFNTENGVAWGSLKALFNKILPNGVENKEELAYKLVPQVLNEVLGKGKWSSFKRDSKTYVKITSEILQQGELNI